MALKGVGGQHHTPADLPPENTRYPLYRRLGKPQGRSGHVRKISPSPVFEPRTMVSCYTDWATWPVVKYISYQFRPSLFISMEAKMDPFVQ
jgi:hypothetical protein